MHSDPNADQLAFEVDGAPTPNENSAPSTSAVTEPSTPHLLQPTHWIRS